MSRINSNFWTLIFKYGHGIIQLVIWDNNFEFFTHQNFHLQFVKKEIRFIKEFHSFLFCSFILGIQFWHLCDRLFICLFSTYSSLLQLNWTEISFSLFEVWFLLYSCILKTLSYVKLRYNWAQVYYYQKHILMIE